MFIIRKGRVKSVKVVSAKGGSYSVMDLSDNKILSGLDKQDVYRDYLDCKVALKEVKLKNAFKREQANKSGKHTCAWCGKKGDNLTVDHIIPLDYFGGKRKIRKNEDTWRKAWNFNNFQMMCSECNKRKSNFINEDGDMSLKDIDILARRLNNKRVLEKNQYKNTPASKIGYGIATGKWSNRKKEMADYVAKADSNVLRLDMILLGQEAYDALPSTI